MTILNILDIIRELNNGNVIPLLDDKESNYVINSDIVRLFVDDKKRYYYFSELVSNDSNDNMDKIEETIVNNGEHNQIIRPKPQYAYLILFFQVEHINESVLKKIIEIEENEYFFKRYVFYYTQDEYKSFVKWFYKQKNRSVDSLINDKYVIENIESIEVKFLLRLLVKIPYITFNFELAKLQEFHEILNIQLNNTRDSTDLFEVHKKVENLINSYENIDDLIEKMYTQELGDLLYEL